MDQHDKKNFRREGRSERRPNDNRPQHGERRFGKPGEKADRKFDAQGEKKPYRKRDDGMRGNKDGKRPFEKRNPRPDGRKPQAKPAPYQPSARDVALKALRNVARENAYAAQALDRELIAVKLSDEDRRLAASIFYFALENRLRIEKLILAHVKNRPEPEVMEILIIGAAQILCMQKIPDHAAVDEAVKQTRRSGRESMTALVNAVLRNIIRERDAGEIVLPDRESEPAKYISECYSVALPLVERLIAAYGVEMTEEIAAWKPNCHSAIIRANCMRMSDAEFEAWMDQNAFEWERAIVPGAYRVSGAGKLAAHEGYRTGIFSIQGESSMLAALAVEAKPGMQVLDACAAPGGKSCLMAEMMKGAGRVYAWDLHEHRVELVCAAARRLELDNLRPQVRDAGKRVESIEGTMDAVLVDAPCSGLGVMGDKPDIKYRLTPDTIDALVPIQKQILETCARYVRPGGKLVYSTCTILPEENEEQVRAFLAAHPEFEPDGDAAWLPEAMRASLRDGMIQILPCRDGIEGFFIARMKRKADVYAG